MAIATLLTDFGTADYYVAAVKGVLLSRAPKARLVDVSHEVEPGNLGQATFLLEAAAPCFPPGTVHLAVVDPGVGSSRRMLAVAAGGQAFIAPDNGLLTPWLEAAQVHAIDRPDLHWSFPEGSSPGRSSAGQTFHGRDRFAPAAAFLLAGGRADELGPSVDDAVVSPSPQPRRDGAVLRGRVRHVDRFGNLVTDIPARWLDGPLEEARIGDHLARRQVRCYAELPTGEAGVLVGSLGTLELSLDGESLARAWAVTSGAEVRVTLR